LCCCHRQIKSKSEKTTGCFYNGTYFTCIIVILSCVSSNMTVMTLYLCLMHVDMKRSLPKCNIAYMQCYCTCIIRCWYCGMVLLMKYFPNTTHQIKGQCYWMLSATWMYILSFNVRLSIIIVPCSCCRTSCSIFYDIAGWIWLQTALVSYTSLINKFKRIL